MTRSSQICAEAAILKRSISIAMVIGETLQLKRSGQQLIALCPFHEERTPSFNVYEDHYHCFGCGAHGDVVDWLMATRRMSFSEVIRHLEGSRCVARTCRPPHPTPKSVRATRSPTAEIYLRCWDEGIDPAGTIVETYLHSRGGLTVPDGAPLRFHPHCQRGKRDLPGGPEYWPAMLALMTDPITGQPVGLHRTYLLPDGSAKAPVAERGQVVLKSKMILGTWGVVRLVPDDKVGRALAIAEGIESALTAMQVIDWGPVWSAGTQGEIAHFPLVPEIEALTIFADADDGGVGLKAARECAQRWVQGGREVLIHIPSDGEDWNVTVRRLAR